MKFAYCGYDFFHIVLKNLIDEGHELVELFSFSTDNEYDFNDFVFSYANSASAKINLSPIGLEDLDRLKVKGVEVLICAAYPYKVPSWNNHLNYALNIHPSVLPEGKGPWPLPWVILKDLRQTGVSIHKISDYFDAGDILKQEIFSIDAQDNLESISLRSQILAKKLTINILDELENLWNNATPQGSGSYWKMPKKSDRTVEFSMSSYEICRVVRAFSKFEPFVFLENKRYFIRSVSTWQENHDYIPGTLVHVANREKVYAIKDGYVAFTNLVRGEENESISKI